MEKLKTRQWQLFNYLLANSDRAVTQRELIDNIGEYEESGKLSHDRCPTIYTDIDKINKSKEIDKIILMDNFNYKIASKEEAIDFANYYLKKALKALKRYWTLIDKINKDGQGKLLSNQDNPIDDKSKAKRFIETFINDLDLNTGGEE